MAAERELRRHRALADRSRQHLLAELHTAGTALDTRELAGRVGLHPNTIRSHLAVLAEAELVTAHADRQARVGRPRLVFEPNATDIPAWQADSPAGPAGSPPSQVESYRLLVEILAAHLADSSDDPRRQAAQAGAAWGRRLARDRQRHPRRGRPAHVPPPDFQAVGELVEALKRLGFSPQADLKAGAPRILLHHCPFHDVATAHPDIVCSIHLGLMKGMLDKLDAPLRPARLRPFATPSVCIAELTRRTGP